MKSPTRVDRRGDWLALAGALAVLAALLALTSCNGDDLIFPGDVPATATGVPTSTATP
ncbi:MAG: hypothetical protein U0802_03770 [Candidatus Binatia bacterium]